MSGLETREGTAAGLLHFVVQDGLQSSLGEPPSHICDGRLTHIEGGNKLTGTLSLIRKCLEKRGVPKDKLPSTSSATGQRLIRHVRQEINRAVNLCFDEREGCQFAYEQLSVASMRFKARAMNAYMRASNLAHIPDQIAWNGTRRGVQATRVKSAYSSQECHVCHYVDRKNRPNQQTFCCRVCGYTVHADKNTSQNIASRFDDQELRACQGRQEVKVLLMKRHEQWKQNFSLVVVQAPVQLGLWASSPASTDVG